MTDPADMTNDEIRVELSRIAVELADHPDDAWPGELYERRQALRNEVTSRPPRTDEVETLERELVGLEWRLTQIERDRPGVGSAGDGGAGGGSGIAEAQEMAFEYDAQQGITSLRERIAFVREQIERGRSAAD